MGAELLVEVKMVSLFKKVDILLGEEGNIVPYPRVRLKSRMNHDLPPLMEKAVIPLSAEDIPTAYLIVNVFKKQSLRGAKRRGNLIRLLHPAKAEILMV